MPKRVKRRAPTIGELYRQIPSSLEEFEKAETRLVEREVPRFVRFCRFIYSRFPSLGKGGRFNKRNQEAVDFLNWALKPEEFIAAFKFVLIGGLAAASLIAGLLYFSPVNDIITAIAGGMYFLVPLYILAPPIVAALLIVYWFQNYPFSQANKEQVRSLTYVPEIIGYMNMSMKLVPNLEKAVEFSAEHGRGKIAEDFRKLIWDVQVGVYSTLSEGLDVLAYRWGKFSEEFKKALMMIRASVIEDSEAKRYAVLDKTLDEVLLSIREKMEAFARGLSQPTIILFYIGVLLPLILIIILPVGSAFSGMPFANPVVLALLYCVIIPLITVLFAKNILDKRPPPKWKMKLGRFSADVRLLIVFILAAGVITSLFLSAEGLPPKSLIGGDTPQIVPYDKQKADVLAKAGLEPDHFEDGGRRYLEIVSRTGSEEEAKRKLAVEKKSFFMALEHDIAPYNLIFGLLLTFTFAVSFFFYFTSVYKRKLQKEIMQMESEFKDSLYILASRLGENKPVEEALRYTKEFLSDSVISRRIFGRTIDNISLLAMPIEAAVFDPNYGSLKNIPSSMIKGSMKLLVDSVRLGVNVAARTMISLSMQLSNLEKVSNMLKNLVSEMVSTMRSMSLFVGPIVLGITTSLQRVVVITIASVGYSSLLQPGATGVAGTLPGAANIPSTFTGMNIGTLIKPEAIAAMAEPTQFIIIIAVYVIELVLILSYFTTKLEEDNNTLVKQNLAIYLPLSVIIFVISVVAANFMIAMFLGGV
jgi:hypothetical protein